MKIAKAERNYIRRALPEHDLPVADIPDDYLCWECFTIIPDDGFAAGQPDVYECKTCGAKHIWDSTIYLYNLAEALLHRKNRAIRKSRKKPAGISPQNQRRFGLKALKVGLGGKE